MKLLANDSSLISNVLSAADVSIGVDAMVSSRCKRLVLCEGCVLGYDMYDVWRFVKVIGVHLMDKKVTRSLMEVSVQASKVSASLIKLFSTIMQCESLF